MSTMSEYQIHCRQHFRMWLMSELLARLKELHADDRAGTSDHSNAPPEYRIELVNEILLRGLFKRRYKL